MYTLPKIEIPFLILNLLLMHYYCDDYAQIVGGRIQLIVQHLCNIMVFYLQYVLFVWWFKILCNSWSLRDLYQQGLTSFSKSLTPFSKQAVWHLNVAI